MTVLLDEPMPAIKKTAAEAGFTWSPETEVPQIGPRDVLVAVTHAGVCGTDRHIYEWDAWSASRVPIGVTVGHEFVGRVVKAGDAVTRAKIGDRISAEGHIGCGNCKACRTGNAHICQHVDILGIDCDGCFAKYVKVPEDNIWHVHPSIPDKVAAVFDPLGNAMHTVMAAGVSGQDVLITGVGIIGLMAVTIARAAGAGSIIVTDVSDDRLALAKELGADFAFNAADPDWVYETRRITHTQGPDVLLEMSGHARAISDGFDALRNGGTAALLGLPAKPVEFDLNNQIIFKGAKVLGINGRLMYETWYQVESFVMSGRLNLDPIITHVVEMHEFDKAIKLMQSGEGIKIVLKMPEE